MQGESWGFLVFVLTSRHVVFYLHFSKLTLKALWTSTYSQSIFTLGKMKRFNWCQTFRNQNSSCIYAGM